MQKQNPVRDVSHASELVDRDDRGRGAGGRLANEPRPLRAVPHVKRIIDEKEPVGVRMYLVQTLGADK